MNKEAREEESNGGKKEVEGERVETSLSESVAQQVFEVVCPVSVVESVGNALDCSVSVLVPSFVLVVTLSFSTVNDCFL